MRHERSKGCNTAPIVSWDELKKIVEAQRTQGKKIAWADGVFDILHAGHLYVLRSAKSLGDILVVGVATDEAARMTKPHNRPIMSLEERVELVASLVFVDYVFILSDWEPTRILQTIRPDFCVKGGDYKEKPLPEAQVIKSYGGKVVILDYIEGVSTTLIIERVLERQKLAK
jgi:rfaE bifunctional protein nucleotidyltransferase chain/domain